MQRGGGAGGAGGNGNYSVAHSATSWPTPPNPPPTPHAPSPPANLQHKQAEAARKNAAAVIAKIENSIDKEVGRLKPRKDRLRQSLEKVLRDTDSLSGCRLEVVGSTSWGGETPQSDLDLVLLSPSFSSASSSPSAAKAAAPVEGGSAESSPCPHSASVGAGAFIRGSERAEGSSAIALLTALQTALQARSKDSPPPAWKRIELVDAPRVPILRLYDQGGLSCDIVVDQRRSLEHRDFMREYLEKRPQVLKLIRLVKLWLRRRGLPNASEGGLPSLAWAVTALHLAEDHPPDTPVDVLLHHFFSKLLVLGEATLVVRNTHAGTRFLWQMRVGPQEWAEEWVAFLMVDDPTQPPSGDGCKPPLSLTQPSIPAALGALYVAELQLAWNAIRQAHWDALWHPVSPEMRTALPSCLQLKGQQAPLHIVLKDGLMHLGQLQEVRRCPGVNSEALHRRDQSSELRLDPCSLEKDGNAALKVSRCEGLSLVCQPCHWVCALPAWNTRVLLGDGVARLAHMMEMVQVVGLAPGVCLWEMLGNTWAGSSTGQVGAYVASANGFGPGSFPEVQWAFPCQSWSLPMFGFAGDGATGCSDPTGNLSTSVAQQPYQDASGAVWDFIPALTDCSQMLTGLEYMDFSAHATPPAEFTDFSSPKACDNSSAQTACSASPAAGSAGASSGSSCGSSCGSTAQSFATNSTSSGRTPRNRAQANKVARSTATNQVSSSSSSLPLRSTNDDGTLLRGTSDDSTRASDSEDSIRGAGSAAGSAKSQHEVPSVEKLDKAPPQQRKRAPALASHQRAHAAPGENGPRNGKPLKPVVPPSRSESPRALAATAAAVAVAAAVDAAILKQIGQDASLGAGNASVGSTVPAKLAAPASGSTHASDEGTRSKTQGVALHSAVTGNGAAVKGVAAPPPVLQDVLVSRSMQARCRQQPGRAHVEWCNTVLALNLEAPQCRRPIPA